MMISDTFILFSGIWNHDQRPAVSEQICPIHCTKIIPRNDEYLTAETECYNAIEGDLCSAKCMPGYEGPNLNYKCNIGQWLPTAQSECKPTWNQ